jgi:hypothetical protein
MGIKQSEREQWRTDFSNEFLCDLIDQTTIGHDPKNKIGLDFGFSLSQALQVFDDRLYRGEL